PAEAGGGQVPVPTPAVERPTRRSTPLARRLAAEHGIALDSIATGSGIGGRVVKADFLADAGIVAPKAAPDTTPAAAPAPAIGDTGAGAAANVETAKGGSSRVGLSRLQTLTARRMAEAKATVPRFQVETEAVLDAARAVDGWAIHG
ncbi:MAG TPA: E3 binding domain-containing protein, partial [Solirubrobacterales bacterium]